MGSGQKSPILRWHSLWTAPNCTLWIFRWISKHTISIHFFLTNMETNSIVFILFQILTFLSNWVSSVSAVEGLTNCEKAIIRYVICILSTKYCLVTYHNFDNTIWNEVAKHLFILYLDNVSFCRGSPSKETCAICKSQVLLSRSYVVNLMIF